MRGRQFRNFLKLSYFGSIKKIMDSIVTRLREAKYTNRIFDERQLGEVLGGSDARRYGLTNRALKRGELLRIKRGLYSLGPAYRSDIIHPFAAAQALVPSSYISYETALSYHGWIPEGVYTTSSVTPHSKSLHYDNSTLGDFTFHPLATCDYQFLVAVDRVKFGELTAFVASPLRALADLAAARKWQWQGINWLMSALRLDVEHLEALTTEDLPRLFPVYKHKAVQRFLEAFQNDLASVKGRADD